MSQQEDVSSHLPHTANTQRRTETTSVARQDRAATRSLLATQKRQATTSYAMILRQMARALALARRPGRHCDEEKLERWYNQLCRRIVGFGGIPPGMSQETLLEMTSTPREKRKYKSLINKLNAQFHAAELGMIPKK